MRVRPDLDEEARLAPGADDRRGALLGAAVEVGGHFGRGGGGVVGVDEVGAAEEDASVIVGIEAIVLVAAAAVVEAQGLGGGKGKEVGGCGGAVGVEAWSGDGFGDVGEGIGALAGLEGFVVGGWIAGREEGDEEGSGFAGKGDSVVVSRVS